MPYGKTLENTHVTVSMTKGEWDILANAVFEYGYEIQDTGSIYDLEKLEKVRHKFETKLRHQLEKPRYKFRRSSG